MILQKVMSNLINNAQVYDNENLDNNNQAIDYLKKNKVSFLDLSNLKHDGSESVFFSLTGFNESYSKELEKLNSWHNGFKKIKKEWDELGIDYIFHKSAGKFTHMSDNLDVLVRTKDFDRAGKILENLGYVNLRNVQEAHKRFYRKFADEDQAPPIHLHERVCWGVPYEDNEHLWKEYIVSEMDELVHYPCPEDVILINIAHCFLEDHLIKIHDLSIINDCLENKDVNWQYITKTANEMHWLHALYTGLLIFDHLYSKLYNSSPIPSEIIEEARMYVEKEGWISRVLENKIFKKTPKMPFKIPHLWTRRHSSLRILHDPIFGKKMGRYFLVFSYLLDGFIHLKLKIKSHPNFFVAFSGLDGSGKTVFSKSLKKDFKTGGIKSKYVWSRAGSLPITRILLKFFRIFKKQRQSGHSHFNTKREKKPEINSITLFFWRLLNSIDLLIFVFLRIRIPLWFGKVVIADRYIYDAMIDIESLGKKQNFNRHIYRVLKLLSPTPAVMFFLNLSPEIILTRGCDEDEADLAKNFKVYNRLLSKTEAIEIENSLPLNEIRRKVAHIALTKFFDKYPDKFNGYRLVSFRYK